MRILSQVALLLALSILSVFAGCSPARQSAATPFDLVIENGHIIDGTGSPWYAADVGIRGGRIAAIGHLASAGGDAPIGRSRESGRAGIHRYARPVGADHPREPAPAVKDLSGNYDGDHRRGRFGRAAQ